MSRYTRLVHRVPQGVNPPPDLPWPTIGRPLVCKAFGTVGSVNVVPNWHGRAATPCCSQAYDDTSLCAGSRFNLPGGYQA